MGQKAQESEPPPKEQTEMSKSTKQQEKKQSKRGKWEVVPAVSPQVLAAATRHFNSKNKVEGCPWPSYGLLSAAFEAGGMGGVLTKVARKLVTEGKGIKAAQSLAAVVGNYHDTCILVIRLGIANSVTDAMQERGQRTRTEKAAQLLLTGIYSAAATIPLKVKYDPDTFEPMGTPTLTYSTQAFIKTAKRFMDDAVKETAAA
jgi:hypothetical protein